MSDHNHPDFVDIQSNDRRGYLVIGLCVVLAVAIVSLVAGSIAESGSRGARSRGDARLADARPPAITRRAGTVVRVAPGERPVPRRGQAAEAVGDEAAWITSNDYPVGSIRSGEQGRVTIRWVIGIDGRASDCGIVETSGYPRLDAAACTAITRSALYSPARAPDGGVIATTKTRRVKWVLPTS